ncbi:hypothetical protein [Catenulispora subtropica]|uniref:Uncharacterized protein n=1 Tax=Catenulispora subtropica TaxID=450798 RepID=A0ABN2SXX0_9ACTN
MGSFYDNALVTAPLERVVQTLRSNGATGLAVAIAPGWTIVYPHENFDAASLSQALDTSVLTADVHDSDVLWLQIWTAGSLVHEYCNAPTYFADEFDDIDGVPHGRVQFGDGEERWLPVGPIGVQTRPFEVFAVGEPDTDALLAALSNKPLDPETPTYEEGYLFANGLHWDAMAALGLPARLLTTGYIYLSHANAPGMDYSAFIPFGNAVQPNPESPQPVRRFTQEQMMMVREQSRMQVTLSGGPRDGEVEWVPFLAMLNGIDSGDGGSYRHVVDPDDSGTNAWIYTPGEPVSNHPWPEELGFGA